MNTRLTKLCAAAITVLSVECHSQSLYFKTKEEERPCHEIQQAPLKGFMISHNVETSLKYGKTWLEIKASDLVIRRSQPLAP